MTTAAQSDAALDTGALGPRTICMPTTLKTLTDSIDRILPQTQCTKCGYDGCLPYARAIAAGSAAINQCPPGGQAGIQQLAALLQRPEIPLDTTRGQTLPLHVAVIDETHCIGCTLCIQACPVDAIVGANKLMHTVVADLCTGCDLCVAPCPVDCISMHDANRSWTTDDAEQARMNHRRRAQRLTARHPEDSALAARTLSNKAAITDIAHSDPEQRQKIISDALARARARRKNT